MNAFTSMTRRNFGCLIGIALLAVLLGFWLSGELFRWHGRTTVDVTVLDIAGNPVPHAELHLRQSGERYVIVIPFASTGRRVEKDFNARTDAKGFCRFTFSDARCELKEVRVGDVSLPILGFTDFYKGVPDPKQGRNHTWYGRRGGEVNVSNVTVSLP